MKVSTFTNKINKILFKNNIKEFHINKIKKNNHLCNSYDKDLSNIILKFPKENKNYNKNKININPFINKVNDI